jgi:hypothetical protein
MFGCSSVSNKDTHQAQVADPQSTANRSSSSHTIDFIPPLRVNYKRKIQETPAVNKSSKMTGTAQSLDVELLRSKLFEAFSRERRYTFKDLMAYCGNVPGLSREKDLKDLLEIYAKYQQRGPNRGTWELKLEYQDHSTKDQAEEK